MQDAALAGRIADPVELMLVRRFTQSACAARPSEYWACGTFAEAMLLGALAPEGFDFAAAQTVPSQLRERSARARDPDDNGFAVISTRRQLERYENWLTQGNGYFPGWETDLAV